MKPLILDFDGTLVKENSSRELEKIIYSFMGKSIKRFFVYFLFFSSFSYFSNLLFGFFSRVFGYGKDFRLKFFLYFTFSLFRKKRDDIMQVFVSQIHLNSFLLPLNNNPIIIASLGLDICIHAILEYHNIQVFHLFSSSLSKNYRFLSKSYADKINFLKNYNSFIYVTDDPLEYEKIVEQIPEIVKFKIESGLIFSER